MSSDSSKPRNVTAPKIDKNEFGYFAYAHKYGRSRYLHSDGVWRDSTFNEKTGKYGAYFRKRNKLAAILEKAGRP